MSCRVAASIDARDTNPSRLLTASNPGGMLSSQKMEPSTGACPCRATVGMVIRRSSTFRRPCHGYGYRPVPPTFDTTKSIFPPRAIFLLLLHRRTHLMIKPTPYRTNCARKIDVV